MAKLKEGSLLASSPGEATYRLSMYRNGKRLEGPERAFNLVQFCRGWLIYNEINRPTIEAEFIFEDAAGLVGTMTGTELFKLDIETSIIDRTYWFRSFGIFDRVNASQSNQLYKVKCFSVEHIKNESIDIFGSSDVIFNNKTETSDIIKTVLRDKRFIATKKRVFAEQTLTKHSFIASQWRPATLIRWILDRSIRKAPKGGTLQNGFQFFENALGFHAKSWDKMIEDIQQQHTVKVTDDVSGKAKLYRYTHTLKNVGQEELDQFSTIGIGYPEEGQVIEGLRHGTYAGYSVGFDPVSITSSKLGFSKDTKDPAIQYSVNQMWKKMSHLNEKKSVNPITQMDRETQIALQTPKRIRYCSLPNQSFDSKNSVNSMATYEQLAELQAYKHMREQSLNQLQLTLRVPGNLDLYVGYGLELQVPANVKGAGDGGELDRRYSGRYIITEVIHSLTETRLVTELKLRKDSILR